MVNLILHFLTVETKRKTKQIFFFENCIIICWIYDSAKLLCSNKIKEVENKKSRSEKGKTNNQSKVKPMKKSRLLFSWNCIKQEVGFLKSAWPNKKWKIKAQKRGNCVLKSLQEAVRRWKDGFANICTTSK